MSLVPRLLPAAAALVVLFPAGGYGKPHSPVVPGVEHLRQADRNAPRMVGEILLGELNCLACHTGNQAAEERIDPREAPTLAQAGSRLTPQYLRASLSAPHDAQPGTPMPDVLPAGKKRDRMVEALVHYLVSRGGPMAEPQAAAKKWMVNAGRNIYRKVGCDACHRPPRKADPVVRSVPLGELASKTTVAKLAAFLRDPLAVRPSGRMPSQNLDHRESRLLAIYLLRKQLKKAGEKEKPVAMPKLQFRYYEGSFSQLPNFKQKPKKEGTVKKVTLDLPGVDLGNQFAVELTGRIDIPADGEYTFYTRSDDGSRLYIDEELVVDNAGRHSPKEKKGTAQLDAGSHHFRVTHFEGGGGEVLQAKWKGPEIEKQPIPAKVLSHEAGKPMTPVGQVSFEVDPKKAKKGRQIFRSVGCAACHPIDGVKDEHEAKPLEALDPAGAGCLAKEVPDAAADFNLSARQRRAIRKAIAALQAGPATRSPADAAVYKLASLNCYACHARNGVGGPGPKRAEGFEMTGQFDLGTEGRIPPPLTGVGAKLQTDAMKAILYQGEARVRPYMATRMPTFGKENLGGLVDALVSADRRPGDLDAPSFSKERVRAGRKLVGVQGLGCVNCHGVAGRDSLGIPAVDLGTVHDRLTPGWFRRYMKNPKKYNEDTRMPAFWKGEKNPLPAVAGGTAKGQIAALWVYLSLGSSMPVPKGLKTKKLVLTPVDQPLVFRTFMKGVGPRAIAVGYPSRVHVAFNAATGRLAKAWRGEFFNASKTWTGRAGKYAPPLGTDRINMPPGPPFAALDSSQAPWPETPDDRKSRVEFLGYRLDDQRRPIFMYEHHGVRIHEKPVAVLQPGGADIARQFDLRTAEPPKKLSFLAAEGKTIRKVGARRWKVAGGRTVTIEDAPAAARKRATDGKEQLILPLTVDDDGVSFEVVISW